VGVASFLTTSGGVRVPNPRHLAATAGRLAVAQRDLVINAWPLDRLEEFLGHRRSS